MLKRCLVVLLGLGLVVAGIFSAGPVAAAEKAEASVVQAKVNVNTAGVEELVQLKGIGEKIAQAIVEHREKNGPFASVDDLIQVKGVGEQKLAAIRDQVTLK